MISTYMYVQITAEIMLEMSLLKFEGCTYTFHLVQFLQIFKSDMKCIVLVHNQGGYLGEFFGKANRNFELDPWS